MLLSVSNLLFPFQETSMPYGWQVSFSRRLPAASPYGYIAIIRISQHSTAVILILQHLTVLAILGTSYQLGVSAALSVD